MKLERKEQRQKKKDYKNLLMKKRILRNLNRISGNLREN
jgi:hypothetical protein